MLRVMIEQQWALMLSDFDICPYTVSPFLIH